MSDRQPEKLTPEIEALLQGLNEPQKEAVLHGEGPLLVFAGAGSGKTRVLTHRAAYLIKARGVSPGQILAVTFTNKAAKEMRERIARLLGQWPDMAGPLAAIPAASSRMWMGTFHSVCARILRADGQPLGISKSFTIFDEHDQMALVKSCLEELGMQHEQLPPGRVLNTISLAKNELVGPRDFEQRAQNWYEQQVARVYLRYQAALDENNALDFDDLIMRCVELFEKHPQILERYQDRFLHILVDEYQDINFAQYRWIQLLAQKHKNLCVVGDDDQSIYGWRGADMRMILGFERDFPGAQTVKLEQNYRSTRPILDAAWHIIRKNEMRREKKLRTDRGEGPVAYCHIAPDEHEEAMFVASKIRELNAQGLGYEDTAVLYRIHAQSRVFEKVLIGAGIPYRIVGGLRFFERAEIKDILAYLRVLHNPLDSVSLRRIINVPPRGIGEQTQTRLEIVSAERNMSLLDVIQNARHLDLGPQQTEAVAAFAAMMNELASAARDLAVTRLVERVLSATGYQEWLRSEGTIKARAKLENVQELLSATREFEKGWPEGTAQPPQAPAGAAEHAEGERVETGTPSATLEGFLESVALIADRESVEQIKDAVLLMTLHSAKGLEFSAVFMVGMEEGLFPIEREDEVGKPNELEEERRLCYVGMTRAKDRLFFSFARSRTIFGYTRRTQVSRFLLELPDDLIMGREGDFAARAITWAEADSLAGQALAAQAVMAPEAAEILARHKTGGLARDDAKACPARAGGPFRDGDRVRHAEFGEGIIIQTQGSGAGAKVKVAFPRVGIKTLAIEYAALEIIRPGSQ
jgi:DNA helicase-2/ATP-dependent DNA helicase PcrA